MRFSGAMGLTVSLDWVPHTPETLQDLTFASWWPVNDTQLWTVVNRDQKDSSGDQLSIAGSKLPQHAKPVQHQRA